MWMVLQKLQNNFISSVVLVLERVLLQYSEWHLVHCSVIPKVLWVFPLWQSQRSPLLTLYYILVSRHNSNPSFNERLRCCLPVAISKLRCPAHDMQENNSRLNRVHNLLFHSLLYKLCTRFSNLFPRFAQIAKSLANRGNEIVIVCMF